MTRALAFFVALTKCGHKYNGAWSCRVNASIIIPPYATSTSRPSGGAHSDESVLIAHAHSFASLSSITAEFIRMPALQYLHLSSLCLLPHATIWRPNSGDYHANFNADAMRSAAAVLVHQPLIPLHYALQIACLL